MKNAVLRTAHEPRPEHERRVRIAVEDFEVVETERRTGAAVALLAFFGPTAILTYMVGRWWQRLAAWPWRNSIQRGLAPVSIGLLLAGCFSIAKGAIFGLETAALAVGVLLILLQTKVNPALLILGAAVIGMVSFNGHG